MYKIEKGIPIPPRTPKSSGFPFDQMGPGDSFFIPVKKVSPAEMKRIRSRVSEAAVRRLGRGNYTVRKTPGGLRVWRVN